jgi:hypothetical protein
MAPFFEKGELVMLEDFIRLAKEGKNVQVSVEVRKEIIGPKAQARVTEQGSGEVNNYLLIGDYTCSVEREVHQVSKVYIFFGSDKESLTATRVHKEIANERLKRDYQRLKDANINIEEKYF